VVAFHCNVFAHGGYIGVDVFFVISGFLITALLLMERQRTGGISVPNFWMRRALRLFPALACAVVLALVLSVACSPLERHLTFTGVAWPLLYAGNWARAFGPAGALGLLAHTWSLAIEEQFYLIWPLVALAWVARARRRTLAAVVLGVLAAADCAYLFVAIDRWGLSEAYNRTDSHAMGLLAGCALAVLIVRGGAVIEVGTRLRWILRGAGAIGLLALVVVAFGLHETTGETGLAVTVATWGATVLVAQLVLAPWGPVSGILGSRLAVWLGRRSYGIYLYHYPLVVLLGVSERPGLHRLGFAALAGALSIAVAAASYRWVEGPFLARKGRYSPAPVHE
jgi:peptidoglycan/LPS O-acetylase OafA/YrhL